MVATSSASSLSALDLTQSIIALVAPRGLIDGSGQAATLKPAAISGTCAWQRRESVMQGTSLAGSSILIVEDEPVIALDLVKAFQQAGAIVLAARSLDDATPLVEQDELSAASSISALELTTPTHCACDWNSGISPSSCTVGTAITVQPAGADSSFRNPPAPPR